MASGPRSTEKTNLNISNALEFSGPGSFNNTKNEEEELDGFVDEFIEIVNTLIFRCLGILDLFDGISAAQEALDKTENLLREKNILRNEIIAFSEFKCQSDLKYLKIQNDFTELKQGD